MKKLFLLMFIATLSYSFCYAQKMTEDKVPQSIKNEFHKKFPKADKCKWEMEKENYEANFVENGKEMSANYDKNGKLLEIETEISLKELPKEVKVTSENDFMGFKIGEIAKIEKADKSVVYEIEFSKDKQKLEVLIDSKGSVLHREDISNKKQDKD